VEPSFAMQVISENSRES